MSSQSSTMRASLRRASLIVGLIAVTGCTTLTSRHGFVPLPEDLEQMVVGQTTREEVIDLVGPPTTSGAVDTQTLYYVKSEREVFGPFAPEISKREVLAISFTNGGVLANIQRFGLEDGRVVVLSRRITDDGIVDVSFIGQLLGAFGNIDAGTLLDGPIGDADT